MVFPTILAGSFEARHGRRLLDHADEPCIPPRVQAQLAPLSLGEVAALRARPHALGYPDQGLGQPGQPVAGLLDQVKGQPLRGLAADTGQPGELSHQVVERAHEALKRKVERQGAHAPDFLLQSLRRTALPLGDSAEDQVRQQIGIPALERLGVEMQGADRPLPVHRDADQPAACLGLVRLIGQSMLELLEPPLHLLAELEELGPICHTWNIAKSLQCQKKVDV
jgi:hypothetical protein